jgi:hypothetical protein
VNHSVVMVSELHVHHVAVDLAPRVMNKNLPFQFVLFNDSLVFWKAQYVFFERFFCFFSELHKHTWRHVSGTKMFVLVCAI